MGNDIPKARQREEGERTEGALGQDRDCFRRLGHQRL